MNGSQKTILLSLVAACALWAGDALMDSLVFQKGPFLDLLLFRLTPHEIYTRSVFITGMLAVLFVLSRTLGKRDRAMAAFQESNETMFTITDAAQDAIVLLDRDGNVSFWNGAAARIFGYAAHEAIGRELHALLAPPRYQRVYQERFLAFRESGQDSTAGRTVELKAVSKGGSELPVEISLSALQLKGKWHAIGILRDITERKRADEELKQHREHLERLVQERTEELHAVNEVLCKEIVDRQRTEEELSRSENFLGTIFDSIHDPFSIVDRDYKIVRFNDAYARMRDKRPGELYGKKCHEALHGQPVVCADCVVDKTFQSKDPCSKEKLMTFPSGTSAWVEIYTYPILDKDRNVSHVVEYTRDITERKVQEEEKKRLIEKLNHLSTTDSLTGLHNRRSLNDMLQHEIERATRNHTDLSLVLCDIDKFKKLNDSLGHLAGDRALLAVASVLQNTLRKSDIAGRYGGDEFMLILPETSLAGAKKLAEKIRRSVETLDLDVPGVTRRVSITLSIGAANCCTPPENIDTLVALADEALYASKESGRNKVSTKKR